MSWGEGDERQFIEGFTARANGRRLNYGYPGSIVTDPRDFVPDEQTAMPDELADWLRDCQSAERGDTVDLQGNQHLYSISTDGYQSVYMTRSMWGMGAFWCDVETGEE